jgi:molybdate transport system ATP-binding protein
MIEVDVAARSGRFQLEAAFSASGQGVLALFGRSGSGKTTLLNILAGLVRPDRGRVTVGDRVLFDADTGIDLRPERRRLGYVFQEHRLFPHLDVRGNLLYGLRRAPTNERSVSFEQIVELLDLGRLLDRRPTGLSGGEKQRVAIGRALLASPRLLLMDEPLASLDAPRKDEVLPFVERLRDTLRLPIVYVTHEVGEIIRLADQVVLMSDGRVAATGSVEEVLGRRDLRPLTGIYEAGSVIHARVLGHDERFALTQLAFADRTLLVGRLDLPVGAAVRLRIAARDVSLATTPPQGISILNILSGSVVEVVPDRDSHMDVLVDVGERLWARVTRRSAADLGLAPGQPIHALIKAVAVDRRNLGL